MSAEYRQEEGSNLDCSANQLGGTNPLPRTGGAPTRAPVIVSHVPPACQASTSRAGWRI